jgi:hypothetical protein
MTSRMTWRQISVGANTAKRKCPVLLTLVRRIYDHQTYECLKQPQARARLLAGPVSVYARPTSFNFASFDSLCSSSTQASFAQGELVALLTNPAEEQADMGLNRLK